MAVQEAFTPLRVTAASTVLFAGAGLLGGFLCTTSGTVTVQDGTGADIVSAIAVTPGQFVSMPFACGKGATILLTGGCIGTVAYLS